MAHLARHAYGSEANVDEALASGVIDAYDILFLNEGKIGWIDKNGKKIFASGKNQVIRVDELPTSNAYNDVVYVMNNEAYVWDEAASKCVSISKSADLNALEEEIAKKADVDVVEEKINEAKAYTDEKVMETSGGVDVVEF